MKREDLVNLLNNKNTSPEIALSGIMKYGEFVKMKDLDKIPSLIQSKPDLINVLLQEAIPYLRTKYEIISLSYPNGLEFKYW